MTGVIRSITNTLGLTESDKEKAAKKEAISSAQAASREASESETDQAVATRSLAGAVAVRRQSAGGRRRRSNRASNIFSSAGFAQGNTFSRALSSILGQ